MTVEKPADLLKTEVFQAGSARLTLAEALAHAKLEKLGEDFLAAARSLRAAEVMAGKPVLAVLGQLNAGKSSVVSSFLSPEGRRRIPRGEEGSKGTHRFVYWIPASWLSDPTSRAAFLETLEAAHPGGVEFLENENERAARQYGSGRDHLEELSVPLVAGDSALDQLGVALLDCPDVQTRDEDAKREVRLDFLSAAARMCSAFLLVWKREGIRDRLVGEVLEAVRGRMAGAPLYLLLNMIRPEENQPKRTLDDTDLTSLLERFQIPQENLYGAFDFRMEGHGDRPGWRDLTPKPLVDRFETIFATASEEIPQFYRLAEGSEHGSDLRQVPHSLESGKLQKQKLKDHQAEFRQKADQIRRELLAWAEKSNQSVAAIHAGLLDLCHGTMQDRVTGEALQIPSAKFNAALNQSFIRTAPTFVRYSLLLGKPFEKAVSHGKDFINSLNLKKRLADLKKSPAELEKNLKETFGLGSLKIASPEALARDMKSRRWCPIEPELPDLQKAWESAIHNFNANPIESFDQKSLDQTTTAVWQSYNRWQLVKVSGKAIVGAVASLTALGGLMTAAVDGGATIYAATAISSAIHGGAALVVGGLGAGAAFMTFRTELLDKNTLPHLSRLFALACDAFGLPRHTGTQAPKVKFGKAENRQEFTLPKPNDLPRTPTILPLVEAHLWSPPPALKNFKSATHANPFDQIDEFRRKNKISGRAITTEEIGSAKKEGR